MAVGVKDWRIGGLEDWRIGGLEDWRIGGLEDWGWHAMSIEKKRG
jgi:hypothetical protein